MLTKIKMFIIRVKDEFYTCMYHYWMSEAEGFVQLERYDEAEHCRELAAKYLIKETELLVQAFEIAQGNLGFLFQLMRQVLLKEVTFRENRRVYYGEQLAQWQSATVFG